MRPAEWGEIGFSIGLMDLPETIDAMRVQFGYGDAEQLAQLRDILRGDALLVTGSEGDCRGRTTLDADGRRVVSLTGYSSGMSREEQMLLAIVLGHEAHRDGIVTNDNYLNTRTAVQAHVQMANRMLDDGQTIAFDQTLAASMMVLSVAEAMGDMSIFNNFVDNTFDSSEDFWRVLMNADGSIAGVQYTGDRSNVTIAYADGTEREEAIENQIPDTIERPFVGNPITDRYGNAFADSFMPDMDNTVREGLLRQGDAAFRDRPGIGHGGCNFLTVLAFAQMVAGQNLTPEQIIDIWDNAGSTVMNTTTHGRYGWMYDSNQLARNALDVLGRNDIDLIFYYRESMSSRQNDIFIGYRIETGRHFVVGNTSRDIIFDSGSPDRIRTQERWDRVYLRTGTLR